MLDIIKTEIANNTPLSIQHDYISYCVKYDFTLGWDIQRFRVLLKHIFETDFECFHKLVNEDAIKWAKCGAFSSEEEAINISNDTSYGLTNYIQTKNKDKAQRVARQLRSGMVEINGISFAEGAPFGGYKHA